MALAQLLGAWRPGAPVLAGAARCLCAAPWSAAASADPQQQPSQLHTVAGPPWWPQQAQEPRQQQWQQQRHGGASAAPSSCAAAAWAPPRGCRRFFSQPDSKVYKERRLIGYSPQQLYDVVASVQHYASFVPWCVGSHVLSQNTDGTYLEAELQIGFQMISERYTSRVTLSPPHRVSSSVADSGLFHHLESTWALAPGPSPQTTWLSFSVDFAFSNPLYSNVASLFFSEVVQRMMGAFEGRASQLYGPPSFAPPARRAEALAAAAQLKQHQQAGHARRGAVLAGSGAGGGEHPQLLHAATEAAAAEAEAEAAAAAAQQGVVSRRQ